MMLILILNALSAVLTLRGQVSMTDLTTIGGNGCFIRIEEVASDRYGNIYVTDAYRFTVKKFSPEGNLLVEFGKRGNKNSDFKTSPYKIICYGETLAIVAKGTACVQLFTDNFIYLGQFSLPGIITDIIFNRAGKIIATIIPYDQKEQHRLLLVDKSGKILAGAPTNVSGAGQAFDMTHVSAGKGDTFIVAYRFRNMIVLYTDRLKIIKYFSVPSFPTEAPSVAAADPEIGKLPEGDLIKDICTDPYGNIFVLGGDYTESPNRDVYLFGPDGTFVTSFKLPYKSGIIHINQQGHLFTREDQRTVLKRYDLRLPDN